MPLVEKKLEKIKEISYPSQYTQIKLSKVFTELVSPKNRSILAQKYPSLCSYADVEELDSLLLIFNNGIDIDPAFSGEVLGKISLNKETKDLEFIIWPIDEKNHSSNFRKEILLKDLSDYNFTFFDPTPETETKNPEWVKAWNKEEYIPPMVKLHIKFEGKRNETFYFFPPASSAMITYQAVK